jgi:hypothetical protein
VLLPVPKKAVDGFTGGRIALVCETVVSKTNLKVVICSWEEEYDGTLVKSYGTKSTEHGRPSQATA